MVAHTLWLWLSVGWLMTWLTEAIISPGSGSNCDLGPCRCTRSKLTCDCTAYRVKDVVLRDIKEFGYSYSSISVANCGMVHVASRAVTGLPALQQVSVANITSLTMEEQAFSWSTDDPRHPGLTVDISHCTIPEVPSYTFRGSLRDVLLTDVNVSRTRPFAFAAIDHADRLQLTRVRVGEVGPQTFKKFGVDSLSVSDSVFHTLPTRTMVDVHVHKEVVFDRLTVDTIKSMALKIYGPKKFHLTRSTVNNLERDALHIHTRGPASVLDNVFLLAEQGSFSGITVETRYLTEFGKQEFSFENNTLISFGKGLLMLNTTGFNPKLDWIVINETCSCPDVELWTSFSMDTSLPHISSVIYCANGRTKSDLNTYRRLHCNVQQSNTLFTLVCIASGVAVLSALAMVVYCCLRERAKRYINVPNSPSPVKRISGRMMVVPDGKTYRETELHVIVEHVEPIVATEYVLPPQA